MIKKLKVELPLEGEALEEITHGMMLAELAITDCKPRTLAKVGRANPWHVEALKMITGSERQAHQSLRTILREDMGGLTLDCEIDVSGITKGGHFLDTQGYIAHNDKEIVLSFRCTTSAFDWLTNFNTTSSAWEIEEDAAQGFSGLCSGFEGLCCTGGIYKPRVHTGFYNNFLAALPMIKEHIDPLLKDDQNPRTLYVVGHSLGAGIATLAGCYFLTEYDWNPLPQRLVILTAGSPRACCNSMKDLIDEKRKTFGNKCRMYRVVKGADIVTSVPPKILGFCHLIDPIKITDEGKIVLQTREEDPETDLLELTKCGGTGTVLSEDEDDYDDDDDECDYKSKYDRIVARVPKKIRDHMPDFYLKPMLKSMRLKYGTLRPDVSKSMSVDEDENKEKEETLSCDKTDAKTEIVKVPTKKTSRTWIPHMFRRKNHIQRVGPTYF